MATHSSVLAWKIPWTEEPSRLHGVAESDMTEHAVQSTWNLKGVLVTGWRHLWATDFSSFL